MKKIFTFLFTMFLVFVFLVGTAFSKPKDKVKFYNFNDLLIDGKVKKPQVLYTDSRQKVKFDRLLRLKRYFIPRIKQSRNDPNFK